jgi:hypothetical protein
VFLNTEENVMRIRFTRSSIGFIVLILADAQPFPNSQTVTFGMIGLAANQTARLSVLNPAVMPLPAPAACSAQITFLDARGNSLKTGTAPVAPQQAISLDLGLGEISGDANRVQIRATVTSTIVGAAPDIPLSSFGCSLIPTLEIFDNDSARTSLILTQATPVVTLLPVSRMPPNPTAR